MKSPKSKQKVQIRNRPSGIFRCLSNFKLFEIFLDFIEIRLKRRGFTFDIDCCMYFSQTQRNCGIRFQICEINVSFQFTFTKLRGVNRCGKNYPLVQPLASCFLKGQSPEKTESSCDRLRKTLMSFGK